MNGQNATIDPSDVFDDTNGNSSESWVGSTNHSFGRRPIQISQDQRFCFMTIDLSDPSAPRFKPLDCAASIIGADVFLYSCLIDHSEDILYADIPIMAYTTCALACRNQRHGRVPSQEYVDFKEQNGNIDPFRPDGQPYFEIDFVVRVLCFPNHP